MVKGPWGSPFTILCHIRISPGGGNSLAEGMEVENQGEGMALLAQ